MKTKIMEEFECHGMKCAVVKVSRQEDLQTVVPGIGLRSTWHNGYVMLPESHPLHGKDYEEIDTRVDVHGGITFGREYKFKGNKGFWVGFDTVHSFSNESHDQAFVRRETERLAEQLKEIRT